jgi:hypothetical protein
MWTAAITPVTSADAARTAVAASSGGGLDRVGCAMARNSEPEIGLTGRLRPLHTSAVIFAFGGNALIAPPSTSCSAPAARACRRLAPWFVFWGYQLFIVLAATGYLLGITQARNTPSRNGTSTCG